MPNLKERKPQKLYGIRRISEIFGRAARYAGRKLTRNLSVGLIASAICLGIGCGGTPTSPRCYYDNLESIEGCETDGECSKDEICSGGKCIDDKCSDHKGYFELSGKCCTSSKRGGIYCLESSFPVLKDYPEDLAASDEGLTYLDKTQKADTFEYSGKLQKKEIKFDNTCFTAIAIKGEHIWGLDESSGKIIVFENNEQSSTITTPEGTPQNIAVDDEDSLLYLTKEGKLYKLAQDGSLLATLSVPGSSPSDIAFDNGRLWSLDDKDDKIYLLDNNGMKKDELNAPTTSLEGIVVSGSSIFTLEKSGRRVYQLIEIISGNSNACCTDNDRDTFGIKNCNTTVLEDGTCPEGYSKNFYDCDDNDPNIKPGATEVCNGKDDNCNGKIDEGDFTRPCSSECGPGLEHCIDGKFQNCDAPQPKDEVCNGKDDNCDGKTDESLEQKCSTECGEGTEICEKGTWKNCTAPLPKQELCNNLDENCNGQIDDGIEEVCYTNCGEGKMICTAGVFGECNAPKPTDEICNGKDDDCDGQVDELAECCKLNDTKNQKTCADGAIKEEDLCINYVWIHKTYIDECPCASVKWVCKDQVIGKQCVDPFDEDDFTHQDMSDSNQNEACINSWCCKNDYGKEYGCWNGHIEINCYCVTDFAGFNDRGEPVLSDGDACPKHDFCENETDISITFKNSSQNDVEAWLNWSNYGYPPGEKKMLQPGMTSDYKIDKYMVPTEGTAIQLCNSLEGCTDDINVSCGSQDSVYREISAGDDYEQCDRHTEVTATFSNFKTLDLVVWVNWLSGGFPPAEKPTISPNEDYTYYLDEKNIPKEGALIELCTSSYGCSQPIEIQCGVKMYFNIDWVFGTAPKKNNVPNNEGEQ